MQLYFCMVILRPDVLRFQYMCENKIFKSMKHMSNLTWRNCRGGERVVSHLDLAIFAKE